MSHSLTIICCALSPLLLLLLLTAGCRVRCAGS
jgi:hypothetical protein